MTGRILAALLVALTTAPVLAASKPYHLQLEAYPAAPFPYFAKFGTVTIDVYDGGVHAESFWLKGFSANGSANVTVENPIARMYTDVPIRDITAIVSKLATSDHTEAGPPPVLPPVAGLVAGVPATRYRIVYGPAAWIDLWTTSAIPPNPQFRAIVNGLLEGISPPTAKSAQAIPGTPVSVELHFRRFQKVTLLRLKKMTLTNEGQSDALKAGSYYVKAPLLDSIWR